VAFFRSLQNSAFTEWLLGSDSIWTYPTVLTLHTVGMAILVGASFVIHLRVLQVAGAIPLRRLRPLYRFIWSGFAINLLSGLILFVTEAADRVVDPVFYVKMVSIAAALCLGVIVKRRAIDSPGSLEVTSGSSRSMAAASLALWVIAIVAGRLMAYLKSTA
jgi:hypothetical protein